MAETSSAQVSDAGHKEIVPPSPGFKDIAPILFSNLASHAKEKGDLADLCAQVAFTDFALPYPAGPERDAILNSIWSSLAAAADSKIGCEGVESLPSLHDAAAPHGGDVPQSVLKEYAIAMRHAGLRFPHTDNSKVLLRAIPRLVPPRLVEFVRKGHNTPQFRRGSVSRYLSFHDLTLPPKTLLFEYMAVEKYVSLGSHIINALDIADLVAECSFLRRHVDLDKHITAATVKVENMAGPLPSFNFPRTGHSDDPFEVFKHAKIEALADIVEVGGPALQELTKLRHLSLRNSLHEATAMCKTRRRMKADEEASRKGMAAAAEECVKGILKEQYGEHVLEEIDEEEIAQMRDFFVSQMMGSMGMGSMGSSSNVPRYRCGHEECRTMEFVMGPKEYPEKEFLDHWGFAHRVGKGHMEAPRMPPDAEMLLCGHPDCSRKRQTYNFAGLRRHAQQTHVRARAGSQFAPLALIDERVAYSD